jgi:hypothetical protein
VIRNNASPWLNCPLASSLSFFYLSSFVFLFLRFSISHVNFVDTNECLVKNGGCDPHVTCNNTSPGFNCPPCPSLFTGNSSIKCTRMLFFFFLFFLNFCYFANRGNKILQKCVAFVEKDHLHYRFACDLLTNLYLYIHALKKFTTITCKMKFAAKPDLQSIYGHITAIYYQIYYQFTINCNAEYVRTY